MLSYKEYDNALAVEIVIKGFVSKREFKDTAKKLEAFIARHGKVNVLEVIEDFEGMEAQHSGRISNSVCATSMISAAALS